MSKGTGLLILCTLLTACGGQEPGACDGELGSDCASSIAEATGAIRSTQGRSTQGRSTQGTEAGSYSVTSASIGGVAVVNLALDGTTLRGTLSGQPISGHDFIGATVVQESPTGDTLEAIIGAIDTDAGDSSGETLLYTLTVANGDGSTTSMCTPDASGTTKAIPVLGRWDYSGAHLDGGFTFGCTSGVIAKCVRWGYRPWHSVDGVSLSDVHQACTRMARADYCGDGISNTQDGTEVDFYDKLGVNVNTAGPLMLFDAAWSTNGAYCIGKERWLELSDLPSVLRLSPMCENRFSLTLLTTSPVSAADLCLVKRSNVPRSAVLMDNRAGINLSL